MRIDGRFHLAASGAFGFDLTEPLDCNVWLLDTADGIALFDSGAGTDIDRLLAVVAADGLDPARIAHLFLTHGHADHSGGAAGLAERLPALRVHAGRVTAGLLADGDERRISLDIARRAGVYPPDYSWRAPPVHAVLDEDEAVRLGDARIRLIATPGHSADHCCYLVETGATRALIAGDAVFYGGRVILQDIPDCSVPETLRSIRRLAELDFEMFLAGHGAFSLRNGRRHVLQAKGFADRMVPPPQL